MKIFKFVRRSCVQMTIMIFAIISQMNNPMILAGRPFIPKEFHGSYEKFNNETFRKSKILRWNGLKMKNRRKIIQIQTVQQNPNLRPNDEVRLLERNPNPKPSARSRGFSCWSRRRATKKVAPTGSKKFIKILQIIPKKAKITFLKKTNNKRNLISSSTFIL